MPNSSRKLPRKLKQLKWNLRELSVKKEKPKRNWPWNKKPKKKKGRGWHSWRPKEFVLLKRRKD